MARINFSRKQNKKTFKSKKSTTKKSGKKHTKQNKKQGGRKTYKKRGGNDKKSFFSKLFTRNEIKPIKAPIFNSSESRPKATLLFWKKYFCLKLEQYQDRWRSYDTEEPFDDIQRYYNYIYNVTEIMVGNIRDKLIDNNPTNYTFN